MSLYQYQHDSLLEVQGLKLAIQQRDSRIHPVDGVDLQLKAGETLAILGESGCGKSLTALALMRLLPPVGRIEGGSIRLDGQELTTLAEYEMRALRGGRIGMIFQEPMTSLNPVAQVGEQIAEAVRLHDPAYAVNPRPRVLELLHAVGIPDPERRLNDYPHQMSGGMKQRVMIAMALAGRPRLLVADEPTTALDVTIQAQVLQLLKKLQRDSGMAVLLITHDLGVVAEVADRVAVMYAGQILESAPAAQFFQNPRHPYSRKLFASLPGLMQRGQPLAVIQGSVPSLAALPPGCRFANRCDFAEPRCLEAPPPWETLSIHQGLRCYRWRELGDASPAVHQQAADPPEPAAEPEARPLLHLKGLEVHFPIRKGLLRRIHGQVRAVDGLDLVLAAGRTLALVGESGCGKTTVGKAVLQLIRPTGGEVHFDGLRLDRLKARDLGPLRSRIQIVFQDPFSSMNPRMRVFDILAEGLRAQGRAGNQAALAQRLTGLLGQVGLGPEALHRYPHEFSGGQRQRIAIARALSLEPELIICDEPTSALDVSVQAQILNLLKELQQRLGVAYLFISHNIAAVAYLADEIAVMYLGRILERGPMELVLKAPAHPYTRALLDAVPEPSIKQSAYVPLSGDMPSPIKPPPGCHFHPRCPRAQDRCRSQYPADEFIKGRWLRCFFPLTDAE